MGLGSWGHISCTHRPVWRQGDSIHSFYPILIVASKYLLVLSKIFWCVIIFATMVVINFHFIHSGDLFLFELRLRRSVSKADAGYRSPREQGWGHSKSSYWTFIMLILLFILSSGLSCSSHVQIVLIMLSSYWPIHLISWSGDAPEAWIPDGRRRELREGAREISPLCVNHLNDQVMKFNIKPQIYMKYRLWS